MSERNPRVVPSLGVLAFSVALGLLSACAAKPATEASAPAQPAAAQPAAGGVQSYGEPASEPGDEDGAVMSFEQAVADFEQAELRISEMLAGGGAARPGTDGEDEAPVEPEAHGKPAARKLSELGDGPDRCLTACQALASMQRSATRLCELTGAGDSRCEDVRDRVERARQLVFDVCPSCVVAQRTDE